jgi:anti-sigma factor RsiW
MNDQRIDDGELHALVDGELDPARQAEVEAWLSENPEASTAC